MSLPRRVRNLPLSGEKAREYNAKVEKVKQEWTKELIENGFDTDLWFSEHYLGNGQRLKEESFVLLVEIMKERINVQDKALKKLKRKRKRDNHEEKKKRKKTV